MKYLKFKIIIIVFLSIFIISFNTPMFLNDNDNTLIRDLNSSGSWNLSPLIIDDSGSGEGADEVTYTPVQQEAIDKGWTPKDDFQGDEEKWVDGLFVWDVKKLKNYEKLSVCIVSGCHNSQFDVTLLNFLNSQVLLFL